ncbi:hypothetical protein NDU88_000597 [Pleurodeles waltl]|uniref:Uncharacterized protein n=1 Tax=Pleurodeles waltl TaxID=8319 RepID=A0AAV7P1B4_PLEWA|nr:hypothetical protein NDU88_000597 [Pleurodeles waltl]
MCTNWCTDNSGFGEHNWDHMILEITRGTRIYHVSSRMFSLVSLHETLPTVYNITEWLHRETEDLKMSLKQIEESHCIPSCPLNWHQHGEKCYFFPEKLHEKSWSVSHEEWTSRGSRLAVIEDNDDLGDFWRVPSGGFQDTGKQRKTTPGIILHPNSQTRHGLDFSSHPQGHVGPGLMDLLSMKLCTFAKCIFSIITEV